MDFFEKRKINEQIENDLREARLASSRDKRIERELKKTQASGKVSSFLQKQSESNDVLRASVAIATSRDPLELAQATIQYQKAVETKSPSDRRRIGVEQIQPEPQTVLPPRPKDNKLYVLTVQNTELKWTETEDCE